MTISYAEEPARSEDRRDTGAIIAAVLVAGAFVTLLMTNVYLGRLPWWILAVYVFMSPTSMLIYGVDKNAAQQGRWRASEQTLLLVDLFGGWIGALFAQILLRHKVRKMSFLIPFWAIVSGHFFLGLLAVQGLFDGHF